MHGSYDFKCLCKHSYRQHDVRTKKCIKCNIDCDGFSSKWSCSCGLKYAQHTTVIETRADRIANGMPMSEVEQLLNDPMIHGNTPIQNFMDLVDGSDTYGAKIQEMEQIRQIETHDNDSLDALVKTSKNARDLIEEIKQGKQVVHIPEPRAVSAFELFCTPHGFANPLGSQQKKSRRGITQKNR